MEGRGRGGYPVNGVREERARGTGRGDVYHLHRHNRSDRKEKRRGEERRREQKNKSSNAPDGQRTFLSFPFLSKRRGPLRLL